MLWPSCLDVLQLCSVINRRLFTGLLMSSSSQAQDSKSVSDLRMGVPFLVEAIMISYKKIANLSACSVSFRSEALSPHLGQLTYSTLLKLLSSYHHIFHERHGE